MTLKIYSDCLSQPSRALVLFCRAANIPHEYHQLKLKDGVHKSEEMTKINPLQTVSLINDNRRCNHELFGGLVIKIN